MDIQNLFPDPLFKDTGTTVTAVGGVTVTGYDAGGDHLTVRATTDAGGYARIDVPFTQSGPYEFHVSGWVGNTAQAYTPVIDGAWIRVGRLDSTGQYAKLADMTDFKPDMVSPQAASLTVPAGTTALRFEFSSPKTKGGNTAYKSPVLCTPDEWKTLQSLGLSALPSNIKPIVRGGGM